MDMVAPHLAWPEIERRARLELVTFRLPHQPDASACARLWRWCSLGTHVTWALFRMVDGDYVVRGRWDRSEAAESIRLRDQLPVPSTALQPRVYLHTLRAPLGLVDRTLAALRQHLDAPADPHSSIVLDGTEYGFEVLEGAEAQRVTWWGHSIRESTIEMFASCASNIEALFE